jgi:hypothetical protein
MASPRKKIQEADTAAPLDMLSPVDGAPAPENGRVLHVNGKPVPEAFAHAIAYDMTDEGIAEKNETRVPPSGITMGADPWDKNMKQRADLADTIATSADGDGNGYQVWDSVDPALAAVAEHGKPGMAHRLLSSAVCAKKGMRGWTPVIAPNGDPVRVGNMTLGQMPEARRQQRNAHYAALNREQLDQVSANIQETQEKLIRAAGSEDVRALRPGERVNDSTGPSGGVTIGVTHSRGNLRGV